MPSISFRVSSRHLIYCNTPYTNHFTYYHYPILLRSYLIFARFLVFICLLFSFYDFYFSGRYAFFSFCHVRTLLCLLYCTVEQKKMDRETEIKKKNTLSSSLLASDFVLCIKFVLLVSVIIIPTKYSFFCCLFCA